MLSSAVRAESAAVAAGRESCPLSLHIHLPWSDGNEGREMQSSTDLQLHNYPELSSQLHLNYEITASSSEGKSLVSVMVWVLSPRIWA